MLNRWVPEPARRGDPEPLPLAERILLTGNATLGYGFFSGKVYNGSSWQVTEITFSVGALEKDGSERWRRQFRHSVTIAPLTTGSFSLRVTGEEGVKSTVWSLGVFSK